MGTPKNIFKIKFCIIFLFVICLNEAILVGKSFRTYQSNLSSNSKFSQNCKNFSFFNQNVNDLNQNLKIYLFLNLR